MTSVPATKATPSRMASEDSASRVLWNRSPASVVRSMTSSLPGALEVVEHGLRAGLGELAHRAPVREEHDTSGITGRDRIVRHHDHCLVHLADRGAQEA